ncbi:PREDICTED: gastrin-releasing peptide [Condylura cristata]|uniref:gastrin-releasing peptide n=1 Tax=Condylura cristata TaxID=143302 RepID=UPI000642A87B|nr:PREDICTED: gastrin-releasing peptide [Condylura cristata]
MLEVTYKCSRQGGHLMGKKSTGESPYLYEGGNLKQQPLESVSWEEATRNLLHFLEAKGTRSHQSPHWEPLGSDQPTWDSEDNRTFKEVLHMKQGSPS